MTFEPAREIKLTDEQYIHWSDSCLAEIDVLQTRIFSSKFRFKGKN